MSHSRSRSVSPDRREAKRSRSRSTSPNRRRRSRSPDESNDGTCLHFSGLHDRTQERDIEDLCSDYGKVESIKLVIDPKTGESRGFAFVVMHSVAAAEKVIDNLDGRELDGRRITVAKSKRKAGRPPTPGRYLGFPRRGGGGYGRGRYERRYDDRRYDDRRYDDRYDNRRYDDRYDDRRRY